MIFRANTVLSAYCEFLDHLHNLQLEIFQPFDTTVLINTHFRIFKLTFLFHLLQHKVKLISRFRVKEVKRSE